MGANNVADSNIFANNIAIGSRCLQSILSGSEYNITIGSYILSNYEEKPEDKKKIFKLDKLSVC